MPVYTVYENDEFKSILSVPEEMLHLNLGANDSYIVGEYPQDDYYIKDGVFIEYPAKPDYPATFNKATEAWEWNEQASWDQLRYDRDVKLQKEVDPIVTNPLRWGDLTTEKQQEFTNYRRALLDLPANTADPRNIVWPTKPDL